MKAHIEFYGSISYVSGLQPEAFSRLRASIFYYDSAILYRTKNNYNAAKVFMIQPDGSFPSGLLKRIILWCENTSTPYDIHDNRYKPRTGYIRFPQLCPEPEAYIDQRTVVDRLVADPWGHGVSVVPTGVGKSRIIKDIIQRLGVKTVVVPPSKNLKNQIFNYLQACFGDMVGFYDKRLGCTKPVTIMNIDAFQSANPAHFRDIDLIQADEFHHAGASGYRNADRTHWDKIYYKFGHTATFFRNNPADQVLLESVLSTELFKMTPIEAMQKKYIVPVQPIMDTVQNLELEEPKKYNLAYDMFIAENLERNGKVCTFAEKMKNMRVPTLILVKKVEHGRHLQDKIYGSVFINGQDEDSEYNMDVVDGFNAGKFDTIIGTSVIGEGVDTKRAGAVILANGEKARSRIWQNIGRVVRNFPGKSVGYALDFNDRRSKFMTGHSKERRKIYSEDFGRDPIILD